MTPQAKTPAEIKDDNEAIIFTGREVKTCDTYFPRDRNDVDDKTGCLLTDCHDGPHECIDRWGKRIRWEFDMKCDCGCHDSDDLYDACIIYNEVK